MKTLLLTALALVAFAGNSVLCRLALGNQTIDAASFTSIRMLSGIAVLLLILGFTQGNNKIRSKGNWKASGFLFLYAVTFSYAYISLETGVGALILFGTVQLTMIAIGLLNGDRLHKSEWFGVVIAFFGLIYLVQPNLSTPSFKGFVLMAIAGAAWGFYSLLGKGSPNPLADTAYNFLRTFPLVIVFILLTFEQASVSLYGVWLAILSGSIMSGIGYAIWYFALDGGLRLFKPRSSCYWCL